MSYVQKKTRVFKDGGDNELARKRSEGRMKTYPSATDARAWCDDGEDRRQYILELIRKGAGQGLALGRYIPIEVIIDTLLANKNADIERLRQQIDELQKLIDMYSQLGLTEDQKRKLEELKGNMGKVGEKLDTISKSGKSVEGETGKGKKKVDEIKTPSLAPSGPKSIEAGSVQDKEGLSTILEEPESDVTDIEGSRIEREEAERLRAEEEAARRKAEEEEAARKKAEEEEKAKAEEKQAEEEAESQRREEEETSMQAISYSASVRMEGEEDDEEAEKKKRQAAEAEEEEMRRKAAEGELGPEVELRDIEEKERVPMDKDQEIRALKDALAAKEEYCAEQHKLAVAAIEQLENIKGIIEERDDLRQKLRRSEEQLETLKRQISATGSGSSPGGFGTCQEEIAYLEREIEKMRQGPLSPEQEAAVIRKEVEVLKKYCSKLGTIQEENQQLKREREALRQQIKQLESGVVPTGARSGADAGQVEALRRELQEKLQKLNDLTSEKDALQARIKELEDELRSYGDLPETVEIYRKRSQMLDDVMQERDSLHKRLEQLRGLDDETAELKRKADRVDELERLLAQLQRGSKAEVLDVQSECAELKKQFDALRAERDMLENKVNDLTAELNQLRNQAGDMDLLKLERDRLQMRLNELANMEEEYHQMMGRLRCLETIKNERNMYKAKYEELLGLECECDMLRAQVERAKCIQMEKDALQRQTCELQCCIADQEDEIKKLVAHIDRLAQGRDDQQERIKDTLVCMRAELDRKDQIIASSEEKLACVQERLRNSIQAVASETNCLRSRIEDLEREIDQANAMVAEKQNQIDFLYSHLKEKDVLIQNLDQDRRASKELAKNEYDAISLMKRELEAARTENEKLQIIASQMGTMMGDGHLEELLRQSKCAVLRVTEELGRHYEQWEYIQGKETTEVPVETMGGMLEGEGDDTIRKLQQELAQANAAIGQMKSGMSGQDILESEVNQLKARIKALEKQLEDANNTIKNLKDSMSSSERMTAENLALRRHSSEVQEVAKEQIHELVDHLKNARERIAELEAENDRLLKEIDSLKRSLQEVGATFAAPIAPSDSMERLRRQLEEVQMEKANLEKVMQQMAGEKPTEGGEDIAQLQLDRMNLEDKLQKEKELREAAEARIQELREAADARIKELEAQLAALSAAQSAGPSPTTYVAALPVAEDEERILKENQILKEEIARLQNELKAAEARIIELENTLKSLAAGGDTEELARLLNEIDKLKREKMEAESNLDELGKRMNEEIGRLKAENQELSIEIGRLKAENQELSKAALAAGPDDDLLARLRNLTEENERLKQENVTLRAEVDALNKTVQDTSGVAEASAARLNNLSTDNDNLRKENAELLAQLDALRGQLGDVRRGSIGMENENKRLQDELAALKRELELSATQMAQMKSESDKYQSEVAKLKAELEKQETVSLKEDEAAKKQIDSLKMEGDKMKQQNEELQKQAEAAKQERDNLQKEVGDLKNENKALKNEIDKLKAENDALKSEIEKLKAQLHSMKGEIEKLQGDYNSLKAENDKLKKDIEGLNKRIEEQKSELDSMLERIKIPSAKPDDILQADLEKERLEKAQLQSLLDDLKNQMKTAADIPQVPAPSDDLNKSLDAMAKKLEQEQQRAEAAEEAMKKYKLENEALRNQVDSLKEEIARLKSALDDALKELEKLKAANAKLEGENKKLRDDLSAKGEKIEVKEVVSEVATAPAAPDVSEYEKKIKVLTDKVAQLEKDKQDLLDKLAKLEKEKQESDRARAALEEENAKLKNDLQTTENELKEQIKSLREQLELERKGDGDAVIQGLEDRLKAMEALLEKQKKECQDTISSLKDQYEREVKRLHEQSETNIDKLQGSHEEVVQDISKSFDDDLSALKQQLAALEKENANLKQKLKDAEDKLKGLMAELERKGEKVESKDEKVEAEPSVTKEAKPLSVSTFENVCICSNFPHLIPITTPLSEKDLKALSKKAPTTCNAGFTAILNKILDHGMESLSFEELHILHTRTCNATANILQASRASGRQLGPPIQQDDKLSLIRRISGLENELMRKQKHAQQKMAALQINLQLEKQKLEELKRTLEQEKQKNMDLHNRIGLHSKAVANLQVERDLMQRQNSHHEEKLQHCKCAIDQERERTKRLQEELERERHNSCCLAGQLEKAITNKKRDTEALKNMKFMLEKTLNSEMRLRMQLEEKETGKPKLQQVTGCPCAIANVPNKDVSVYPTKPKTRSTTFRTEFSIPDSRNTKTFTHHCCTRNRSCSGNRSASTQDTLDIDES